eukprot:3484338-Rhodomonas_salina.1
MRVMLICGGRPRSRASGARARDGHRDMRRRANACTHTQDTHAAIANTPTATATNQHATLPKLTQTDLTKHTTETGTQRAGERKRSRTHKRRMPSEPSASAPPLVPTAARTCPDPTEKQRSRPFRATAKT